MQFIEFLKQISREIPHFWAFFAGFLLLFLSFLLSFSAFLLVLKGKKPKKEEVERQEIFTLPDRENTFVRDRLNAAFVLEREDKNAEKSENRLRLEYVRGLVSKLKAASLSAGDRLECENLSRLITLYASKDALSAYEARRLNDCLSLILKMAAKYSL